MLGGRRPEKSALVLVTLKAAGGLGGWLSGSPWWVGGVEGGGEGRRGSVKEAVQNQDQDGAVGAPHAKWEVSG